MTTINYELLDERILKSGYTRKELAKQMKCSRRTLFNVAHGHTTPSLYIATKLAEVLNLTQEDLINIFFADVYKEMEKC